MFWGGLGCFGVVWGVLGWFGVIRWTATYTSIDDVLLKQWGNVAKQNTCLAFLQVILIDLRIFVQSTDENILYTE